MREAVNTQEKYVYIYIYIYIYIVFLKKINLRSWEGGVKPVLDRPKQG